MVDLMNVLVERAPVERAMRPVMPGVFQHKKHGDLIPALPSMVNDQAS